jgi:hypothetical protein
MVNRDRKERAIPIVVDRNRKERAIQIMVYRDRKERAILIMAARNRKERAINSNQIPILTHAHPNSRIPIALLPQ